MKSPRLQRFILIVFGLSLALIAGLFIQRALVPADMPQPVPNCEPAPIMTQVSELLRLIRLPCQEMRFMWPPDVGTEYNHLVQFNNFGLHAPTYALEKSPGVYRILLIGDSFPQGVQVPVEEGFPWLLSEQMSQASGKRVEVINLSIDAYGTDRELLLYALLGWQFQPDLVLLSLYPSNDVQDNQIDLETRRYGYQLDRPFFTLSDSQLVLHNSPTFDPAQYPDSRPYQWLTTLQAEQQPAPPQHLPEHPTVTNTQPYTLEYPVELGFYLPEDDHWKDAWKLTEALILQFRDGVESAGVPFGVVIVPDRRAVNLVDWQVTQAQYGSFRPELWEADPQSGGTRLEIFLAAHDIPALNLTPALRDWAADHPDERLYFEKDGHFNPTGHALAAEQIALWLRERLGV